MIIIIVAPESDISLQPRSYTSILGLYSRCTPSLSLSLCLSVCTFCLFIIWSIMKQPRVKAIICTNRRFHYALFVSRAVARSLLQNSSELDDFCATPNDGSGAGPRRAERKLAGWNKPFHPNGESSRWSLSRERGCAWSGWRSSFCVALVSFYVSFLHMFENCQVLFYRSLFY